MRAARTAWPAGVTARPVPDPLPAGGPTGRPRFRPGGQDSRAGRDALGDEPPARQLKRRKLPAQGSGVPPLSVSALGREAVLTHGNARHARAGTRSSIVTTTGSPSWE